MLTSKPGPPGAGDDTRSGTCRGASGKAKQALSAPDRREGVEVNEKLRNPKEERTEPGTPGAQAREPRQVTLLALTTHAPSRKRAGEKPGGPGLARSKSL